MIATEQDLTGTLFTVKFPADEPPASLKKNCHFPPHCNFYDAKSKSRKVGSLGDNSQRLNVE